MSNITKEELPGYTRCLEEVLAYVDTMSERFGKSQSFSEVMTAIDAFMYSMHKTKLTLAEAQRSYPAIILPFNRNLKEVKNNE